MNIIVAGGGIGGLVTALSLHQAGHEVRVYESVEEVKPLGVGINLLPHAVRVLAGLGLLDRLHHIALPTRELVYANRFGQFFWTEARGQFAGYHWPQFSIHRGRFQVMLWEACRQALGSDRMHTNAHLTHAENLPGQVRAHFLRKSTQDQAFSVDADLLIGADGIHSVLRKQCYPNEGEVVFSGSILYRGTAWMKPFLSGSSMAMIGSNQQKMVVYPIEAVRPSDGLQQINWVANLASSGNQAMKVRDWNREVGKTALLERYAAWQFSWIDIPEMIRESAAIYEFPMSDRNPLPAWSFGRMTLLGDAAHPMYPIGSNGASQAILDAEALTLVLSKHRNPEDALQAYDAERVPATAKVVLQNRQKGPDAIMDLMEERFPEGFRQSEIPVAALESIMADYKKIAGFDIQSLNAKS